MKTLITISSVLLTIGVSTLSSIKLDFFKAESNEHYSEISWALKSSDDSAKFVLEKSTNGINFSNVNTKSISVNSNEYKVIDSTSSNLNSVVYYRLTLEKNEEFEVQGFCVLSDWIADTSKCSIDVSPSPCLKNGQLNVNDCNTNSNKELLLNVDLIDITGSLVHTSVPVKNISGTFTYALNKNNNFAPGLYIVNVNNIKRQIAN